MLTMTVRCLVLTSFLAFGAMLSHAAEEDVTIEVVAGEQGCAAGAPIEFELPKALRDEKTVRAYALDERGASAWVQCEPDLPNAVWLLDKPLKAGETRRYALRRLSQEGRVNTPVACLTDENVVRVECDNKRILHYHTAEMQPPEGVDPVFASSGFLHPVFTPSGRLATDDFPPDHAHQHGVFFAWVNATFDGRDVDFWNIAKGLARVRHVKTTQTAGGPVFAQFDVELVHEVYDEDGDATPVLRETWSVRVYRPGDGNLFDLVSRQRAVSDKPLTINEYHYGGFAIRGARAWFQQEGAGMLTSEGLAVEDGNHSRPKWVEMFGRSAFLPDATEDLAPCAICVLDHPSNFRFPQPVRLHPTKPYFCFAPMVLGEFEIDNKKDYTSRYRLWTHDGPPDAETADALWNAYADPPTIRVVSE